MTYHASSAPQAPKGDHRAQIFYPKHKAPFSNAPYVLAWAITIHKSQGLTFNNVVIDLGTGAFVNGQLYTALSRCRRLSGIVLKKKVNMILGITRSVATRV